MFSNPDSGSSVTSKNILTVPSVRHLESQSGCGKTRIFLAGDEPNIIPTFEKSLDGSRSEALHFHKFVHDDHERNSVLDPAFP